MQTTATSPCRILKRDTYGQASDGRAIAHKDGEPVEYVDLYDVHSGDVWRMSVMQGLNGEAAPGSEGYPVVEVTKVERSRRDGSTYTSTRLRLVGFEPLDEVAEAYAAVEAAQADDQAAS